MAEKLGLAHNKLILSAKVSKAPETIEVNRLLSQYTDIPLHVGVTEAGLGIKGAIATMAGLGVLLFEGIGDTIRTSLTPSPKDSRTEEVFACQLALQLLGIRNLIPTLTSCPGCGRTTSKVYLEIANEISIYLRKQTPIWKKKGYKGVEGMVVAVMGCHVNGPGECKDANIGLSLPGTGEEDIPAQVFKKGEVICKLSGSNRIEDFKKMIEEYVESNFMVLI